MSRSGTSVPSGPMLHVSMGDGVSPGGHPCHVVVPVAVGNALVPVPVAVPVPCPLSLGYPLGRVVTVVTVWSDALLLYVSVGRFVALLSVGDEVGQCHGYPLGETLAEDCSVDEGDDVADGVGVGGKVADSVMDADDEDAEDDDCDADGDDDDDDDDGDEVEDDVLVDHRLDTLVGYPLGTVLVVLVEVSVAGDSVEVAGKSVGTTERDDSVAVGNSVVVVVVAAVVHVHVEIQVDDVDVSCHVEPCVLEPYDVDP
ncbi:hypothetical protein HK105_200040 [Polyrhizophydium stewartii]|uniref:Uncharacterized protein n=1 Tax=Polyrhizophydium stewartii TaxID=2732419 RepID=A0ABR4NKC1_9FUNG